MDIPSANLSTSTPNSLASFASKDDATAKLTFFFSTFATSAYSSDIIGSLIYLLS